MHEFTNTRTSKGFSVASDIFELKPDEWLFYIDLMLKLNSRQISIEDFKHQLFAYLTKLKASWKMKTYLPDEQAAIWDAVRRKAELMNSFFDIEDGADDTGKPISLFSPHWLCGENLLPTVRISTGCKLYGPATMLNNLSWGDFSAGAQLLSAISKCFEDEDTEGIIAGINELFCLLYKPCTRLAKLLLRWRGKRIPYAAKYSAFLFFRSVYQLICTVPIPIHGEEIDFSILFNKSGKSKNDKTGWEGLRLSIAEAGLFGVSDEVKTQNLWEILIYLYKCEYERQLLKQQTPTRND